MEYRVESLMRNEVLLEYEVGFTFPKRHSQEELEARILNLIDHQEDHVRQLEQDMRKTKLSLGWILEEIHVTWAHLEKKHDKITTLHNKGLKNLLQTMETTSGFHATPSGLQSDGVRTLATASERNGLSQKDKNKGKTDKTKHEIGKSVKNQSRSHAGNPQHSDWSKNVARDPRAEIV
ncbi:hypothetical protein Tco_1092516 [Tanacetum coccineum]|uniref:Uncharacterized protein n=1 Tax=Tanacetum coccineum TaxID=301880 RepID=A0ABQ5ICA6_9ASTR